MKYVIEKGIEFPLPKNLRIEREYPLVSMEIGDSFLIPISDENEITRMKADLCPKLSVYGGRKSKRFLARVVDGGIRVWRDA